MSVKIDAAVVPPNQAGPAQVDLIAAILAVVDKHAPEDGYTARQMQTVVEAADKVRAAFGGPPRRSTAGAGLVAWLLSDDVGASSLAMARHLGMHTRVPGWEEAFQRSSDRNCINDIPRDMGDFGRCLTLLAAVPEFAPHLKTMATVSAAWSHVVARWDWLARVWCLSREQDRDNLPRQARANRDVLRAALQQCADTEDWAEVDTAE